MNEASSHGNKIQIIQNQRSKAKHQTKKTYEPALLTIHLKPKTMWSIHKVQNTKQTWLLPSPKGCVCLCMSVCSMHVCECVCACGSSVCVCLYAWECLHVCKYICVCVFVRAHVCMCMCVVHTWRLAQGSEYFQSNRWGILASLLTLDLMDHPPYTKQGQIH